MKGRRYLRTLVIKNGFIPGNTFQLKLVEDMLCGAVILQLETEIGGDAQGHVSLGKTGMKNTTVLL